MDAEKLPTDIFRMVDAVCTSPTYGNRMADHFKARDTSVRYTYRGSLGRDLDQENTGRMHFGLKYQEKHGRIYQRLCSNLRPGGVFILNTKNFICRGETVDVTEFHAHELKKYCVLEKLYRIPAAGVQNGANRAQRAPYETIHVFRRAV
jgi:hypothetical protein